MLESNLSVTWLCRLGRFRLGIRRIRDEPSLHAVCCKQLHKEPIIQMQNIVSYIRGKCPSLLVGWLILFGYHNILGLRVLVSTESVNYSWKLFVSIQLVSRKKKNHVSCFDFFRLHLIKNPPIDIDCECLFLTASIVFLFLCQKEVFRDPAFNNSALWDFNI